MSQPELSEPLPDAEAAASAAEAEPEAPPPEPWTPERALEWNRYYDRYVVGGVLLLVLFCAIHPIANSAIWPQLQAGRLIARSGPLTTDPFSYTMGGQRWVNIPWTFELVGALLHDTAGRLFPLRRTQVGAGVVIGLCALVQTLTAFLLLRLRRPGPGTWWVALCVAMALGAIYLPPFGLLGLTVGGIAGRAIIGPATWGLACLAGELLLIDRALAGGRRWALYALPALFVAWANVDESFVFGLAILAAALLGSLVEADQGGMPGVGKRLAILAGSGLACLLNPSTWHAFVAAAWPYIDQFSGERGYLAIDEISHFGPQSRDYFESLAVGTAWQIRSIYLTVVIIGFLSFALNRRRFSPGRFLAYAVAAGAWALLIRLRAEFAVVWAAIMARNGQEWYLDTFGAEGRIGNGWSAWSVGGRALTILALFVFMAKGLTGYATLPEEPVFGFGVDPHRFAFEAAEFLRTAPMAGKVVNLSTAQGDALIWKGYPARRTYLDSRHGVFPERVRSELEQLKRGLREDDPDAWRPILDAYEATALMLAPEADDRLYKALARSPDWIAIHDDGNAAIFGRADAPEADLAFFQARRLDASAMVYQRPDVVPVPDRPPTEATWIDKIVRRRAMTPPDPHVLAAARWLGPQPGADPNAPPTPAQCFMAIRQARTALSHDPDDTYALRQLDAAYDFLTRQEQDLIRRSPPPSTADPGAIDRFMVFRNRQRAAALSMAIRSTPPPITAGERDELGSRHLELAQFFLEGNDLDLARDQLQEAHDLIGPAAFPAEMQTLLTQLDEQYDQFQGRLADFSASQQAGAIQRASFALAAQSQGFPGNFPGTAIQELEQAESEGISLAQYKATLIDLYCRSGLPDEAYLKLILSAESVNDPSLATGPGTAAYRQAVVHQLLGYYDNAVALLREHALFQLRAAIAQEALGVGRTLIAGEPNAATTTTLEITGTPQSAGRLSILAEWEAELGLILLEAGNPAGAAEQFTRALTIAPGLATRPVLAYYLEQLGRDVPPPPAGSETAAPAAPATPLVPLVPGLEGGTTPSGLPTVPAPKGP